MVINRTNSTQSLAAALQGVDRLDTCEAKKREQDTLARGLAKAAIVSISTVAKVLV